MLFSVLVLWSTKEPLRRSVMVLMQEAPPHINVTAYKKGLLAVPHVRVVHDLHVPRSTGDPAPSRGRIWMLRDVLLTLSGAARTIAIGETFCNTFWTFCNLDLSSLEVGGSRPLVTF